MLEKIAKRNGTSKWTRKNKIKMRKEENKLINKKAFHNRV